MEKVEEFKFINFFPTVSQPMTVSILAVEGRCFPVDIYYLSQSSADYIRQCVDTVIAIHKSQPMTGDILAFLTGMEEIERAARMIKDRAEEFSQNSLIVYPLYGGLPHREQLRALDPPPVRTRKAILSTNIAETSLTIDGIQFVVDSGFTKVNVFSEKLNMDQLTVTPVSRASADQRAGRSGRTQLGVCFRLYPEAEYEKLRKHDAPDIQRCSLSNMILRLGLLGVENVGKVGLLEVERVLLVLYKKGRKTWGRILSDSRKSGFRASG